MADRPDPACHRRLIVGCGYLGQRVADRWLAAGDTVFATTRSPARADQFAAIGLRPLLGDVTVAGPGGLPELPEVDTVLWAVGFDRSAAASYEDVHVTGLGRLLDRLGLRVATLGSAAIAVVAAGSLGLVESGPALAVGWGVGGGLVAALVVAYQAMGATIAPDNRGGALSFLLSFRFVGHALGPIVLLPLFDWSYAGTFAAAGALGLVTLAILIAVGPGSSDVDAVS